MAPTTHLITCGGQDRQAENRTSLIALLFEQRPPPSALCVYQVLLGVSLALLSVFSSATSKGYQRFLINYRLINSLPIDS